MSIILEVDTVDTGRFLKGDVAKMSLKSPKTQNNNWNIWKIYTIYADK